MGFFANLYQSLTKQDIAATDQSSNADRSLRLPAVVSLYNAAVWLMVASVLGLINTLQLHSPDLLAGCSYTTFGRIQSTFYLTLIFGWLGNATFLLVPWILVKLSQRKLESPVILVISNLFWNLGVALGVVQLFMGQGSASAIVDVPATSAWLFAFSLALGMSWAVLSFVRRQTPTSYISEWCCIGIVCSLCWILTIYAYFIDLPGATGLFESVLGAWFQHNVVWMWMVPLALAVFYYLLPKLSAVSIKDYHFAPIAFSSFFFIATWGGLQFFYGGALPAWMPTVSIASLIFLVFPLFTILLAIGRTVLPQLGMLWQLPSLKFSLFSLFALLILSLATLTGMFSNMLLSLSFTFFSEALLQWGILGVGSMAAFAAIYVMVPRVLSQNWTVAFWVKIHFTISAVGILLLGIAFFGAAWVQGSLLSAVSEEGTALYSLAEVNAAVGPWLLAKTAGFTLFFVSSLLFVVNIKFMFFTVLIRLLHCCSCAAESSPDPVEGGVGA